MQQGVAFGHAASLVKWMAQGTVLGKRAGESRESASRPHKASSKKKKGEGASESSDGLVL